MRKPEKGVVTNKVTQKVYAEFRRANVLKLPDYSPYKVNYIPHIFVEYLYNLFP